MDGAGAGAAVAAPPCPPGAVWMVAGALRHGLACGVGSGMFGLQQGSSAEKRSRQAQRAWQRSELPMAQGRSVRPASCRRTAGRLCRCPQAGGGGTGTRGTGALLQSQEGACSTSSSGRGRLSSSSSLAEWQPGGSSGRGGGGDEQCQHHEAAACRCFGRARHGAGSVQGGDGLR